MRHANALAIERPVSGVRNDAGGRDFSGPVARIAVMRAQSPEDWTARMLQVRDQRDLKAFEALFHHFAPRVKSYLLKAGGSDTLAEEATQEAMATLWHKAHLFDPAKAAVSTWVFTIARNKQVDLIRKQRRPIPEDPIETQRIEPDVAEDFAIAQEQTVLRKAVAELPSAQRKLIEQAFYGDLSHTEIAAMTDLPLGTIKSRIRLGLERLRRDLKESLS